MTRVLKIETNVRTAAVDTITNPMETTETKAESPAKKEHKKTEHAPIKPKKHHINMVLPTYDGTELEQIQSEPRNDTQWATHRGYNWIMDSLQQAYHYISGTPTPPKQIDAPPSSISPSPYEIKKVVIIGVHGWFPGSILRRVLGDPVGTSSKFATMMGFAVVKQFKEKYGISLSHHDITFIPLGSYN
jgi:hypothetical protein